MNNHARVMKQMFRVYAGMEVFRALDGSSLSREYGNSPNGNPFDGKWVYRDNKGNVVDHDRYRNDIIERNYLICTDKEIGE